MKYGISKKSDVQLPFYADTNASTYEAKTYKVFRKFATRAAARSAKQAYKKPQNYSIINLTNGMVVR